MSLRPLPSTSSKSSSLEECPGAPDLRALACPVFPPFEFYMDDSVETPSMSEGPSAESSLDFPSPSPESATQVLQVLTTSLTRPNPLHGFPSSVTTKEYDWIDLVKQGGATPDPLFHPHLPSNELPLFPDDLNPEPSSPLVSDDSAAFEDAVDDLPPPCLLNAFSSLSKHVNRPSDSCSRSHPRNPTKRDGMPLTEPEIPKDDDVFFHRDLCSGSCTSPSEGTVGSITLTTFPSPEPLTIL
jgi:hypothetical protein